MIELQPFGRVEIPRLASWGGTPELLMQWGGPIFSHPLEEAQIEKYFKVAETEPNGRKMYKAVRTDTGEPVGHIDIELDRIDPKTGSASVEHVLVGDLLLRGKGVGTLMMQKILDIGFGQLGLHRISLFVFDFNQSVIACYEKAGFAKEGLLREAIRFGNQYWNLYMMSVLEQDWKSRNGK